jgi:RNA polymerase sigma factor (sigma-70 family)
VTAKPVPTKKQPWKELPPRQIERALRGNHKDLDALVRWYGPVVWASVAARVRGIPSLALQMEDIVGSVWLELCRNGFKRLRYYDHSRGEFGYFIRLQAGQIAWNLVLRQLGRPELVSDDASEPIDEGLEAHVLSRNFLERLAQRAQARLSESDWALLNATYVEGLTSEEAAERFAKKFKTVYQQKHRLRGKLELLVRELLAETRPSTGSSERQIQLVVATIIAAWLAPCHGPPIDVHPKDVEFWQPAPLDSLVR